MAAIYVVKEILHWPLDRIISADVWATDTISADLPPMMNFKNYADAYIFDDGELKLSTYDQNTRIMIAFIWFAAQADAKQKANMLGKFMVSLFKKGLGAIAD